MFDELDIPQSVPSNLALEFLQAFKSGIGKTGKSALIDRIRRDHFWFSREVLGNDVVWPSKLTGDWGKLYNFIWGMGEDWQFGEANSPRNSYKTTIICAKSTHLIALDRNIRILYITNNHRNARRVSGVVRRYLEGNEILLEACGTFKPDATTLGQPTSWTDDYFFVSGRTTKAKEPTFTISTTGTAMASGHFDIIIVDDPVDEENSKTKDSLQSTIDWYRLLPKLMDPKSKYGPGGVLLDCGTRYDDGDVHGWLLGEIPDAESPYDDYKHLVLRAMENPECWDEKQRKFINPILNFPEVLDEKKLTAEYKNGSSDFYKQYQNECRDAANQIFKREQFRIIKPYDVPGPLNVFILTDFSKGGAANNDRTALWVVGLDWRRTAYCLDFDVGRWGLDERIRRTLLLAQKYDAMKIGIEDMWANEGVLSHMAHDIDVMRMKVVIELIGGRTTEVKEYRIESLQPRFERQPFEPGGIFFVERNESDQRGIRKEFLSYNMLGQPAGEIVHEFIRFPKATHDDIPDALSDIDKQDKATKAYLFPGPSKYATQSPQAMTDQRMAWSNMPSMQNGRIVNMPLLQQTPQQEENIYAWAARRLRGTNA